MPAKGSCKFCTSKRRAELEDAARSGRMTQAQVAEALGQAKSGVCTHLSSHGPAPLTSVSLRMPTPPAALDGTPSGRALDSLMSLHEPARQLYEDILQHKKWVCQSCGEENEMTGGSPRDIAQLLTGLRRNLELRRELEEKSRPPDPDSFDPLRDGVLAGIRDRLAEALRPWPDAVVAAVEALRR